MWGNDDAMAFKSLDDEKQNNHQDFFENIGLSLRNGSKVEK
jgi:hypothetical protein